MVTTTTTYSLKKPTVGQDDDAWGGYLNDSMDLIDDVLDGTVPVTGIDINSGTLDNVVIGGTTANTGTFTVLSATTSLGVTGNITVSGTVDGVDIAARDAVLTSTTTTANAALPKAGGTMTGTITFAVGQTFDGRDVSADGAKLDGIEAGATADQTKADIDALGIAASTAATLATARNIALTGDVSGSASFNGSANISITATVADDSHNHVISNVDGLQTALDGKLSTSGKAADSNLLDGVSLDSSTNTGYRSNVVPYIKSDGVMEVARYVDFHTTGSLVDYDVRMDCSGADTLTFTGVSNTGLQSNGNTIWHAGNDGSGSGLDADLWDGNQFSSYLNQAVLSTSSPSFAGLNINGNLNAVDHIYLAGNIYHEGDTNTYIAYTSDTINMVTGGGSEFLVGSNYVRVVDAALQEDYDALSGTTPTCNVSTGGAFSLTMTGSPTTFTFSGAVANWSQGFVLQLTGNGGTISWPASVKWAGGTVPDAPASGETDIYVFWTRDGGTTWYGVQSIDAAA